MNKCASDCGGCNCAVLGHLAPCAHCTDHGCPICGELNCMDAHTDDVLFIIEERDALKKEVITMREEAKVVLGIMSKVNVGMRDVNQPVMWFQVETSESSASLQVLSWEQAGELIKAYGVYELSDLEGKPIWMRVDINIARIERYWSAR